MKQSALQRINRVLKYYLDRGTNKESVNKVYRNILKEKFKQKKTIIEIMEFDEKIGMYENQFKPKDYGNN